MKFQKMDHKSEKLRKNHLKIAIFPLSPNSVAKVTEIRSHHRDES